MKYDRALLKRAYNHKENADEETKDIIEKLMEAYNLCYGELRGSNADIYELRERLRNIKLQATDKPKKRRKKRKKEEPKIETKSIFFGGAND